MLEVARRSLFFLTVEKIDSQDLTSELLTWASSVMWISTFRTGIDITNVVRRPVIEKNDAFILMLIKYTFSLVAMSNSYLNIFQIYQELREEGSLYA